MALLREAIEPTARLSVQTRLRRWVSQTSKESRQHAAAIVAILAFTVIQFAPVLSGRSFSMVGAHMYAQYPWAATAKKDPAVIGSGYPQTDHAETFYPANVFATNAVRSGQLPLWLPYSFGGIPIAEVGLGTGLLYPPKLIAMVFLRPIDQHDLILFLHYLLAGLAMYALLRSWEATALGAIFGAVAWEFSGYNAFWLTMEHAAIASAWFPLMMLGAVLTIRKQSFKWSVATGAAVGMALLSGLINHVYLSIFVVACWYALLTAVTARRLFIEGRHRAAWLCLSLPMISAIVAVAIGAASWLAVVDMLPLVHRQPQTLGGQLHDSIPFLDIARALIRPVSASGPAGKLPDAAGLAFIGIPALILAPLAMLRRSLSAGFVAVVCMLSVAFAAGFTPLLILLRSTVPYFGAIHPYTGFFISSFSIAVLAAFGISETSKRLKKKKAARQFLLGLVCLLIAVEAWQLITYTWATNPVQPKSAEWLFPETPVIKALQDLQGEYHILPVTFHAPPGQWVPPVLAGKVAGNFGLRSVSGYESLLPIPTAGIWSTVEHGGNFIRDFPLVYRPYFYHDSLPLTLLEKTSVGLLVTPPQTMPRDVSGRDLISDGTLQLVYQGADGWIYRDTRALPRAFLVPRVVSAPDAPTALGMLIDPAFDARKAAIVIGEPTSDTALLAQNSTATFEATARIISDRLNDVEVECVTPNTAMMVLNDSWAPGWKAFVDGEARPVLRVNYAFRGVVVPEGPHRVLFLYRPTLLLAGLAISAISLMLVCILYAWIGVHSLLRSLNTKPARAREKVSDA